MKKIAVLFGFLMFLTNYLAAHERNNKNHLQDTVPSKNIKVMNAIERFKTSDFMMRFNDCRTQMEIDARDLISRQNSYSLKDVREIRIAYDKTAIRFNNVLNKIKLEFKDPENVKIISKSPDILVNKLKTDITELEDFYKTNFNKKYEDVTEKASSPLLGVLVELIKTTLELTQQFKNIKFEKEYMNEQYIQQNLVDPNRVPTWAELSEKVTIRTDVKIHPSRNNN